MATLLNNKNCEKNPVNKSTTSTYVLNLLNNKIVYSLQNKIYVRKKKAKLQI